MSSKIINKTMDRRDLFTPEAAAVVRELDSLIRELRAKNLRIGSWYGAFGLDGDSESFERVNRGYGYAALPVRRTVRARRHENERFVDSGENYLLHPFFYRRVGLDDLWRWKADGLRAGQFPRWQFPLVKWWNDYTFGALFQEKVG
jgi:hypothetical protein